MMHFLKGVFFLPMKFDLRYYRVQEKVTQTTTFMEFYITAIKN